MKTKRQWWPFLAYLGGLQIFLGFLGFFIVCGLTQPCDVNGGCGLNSAAPLSEPCIIELLAWGAPWILGITGWIVAATVKGIYRHWPRRIVEPVIRDLRRTHQIKELR